jgi:hypothetical protein
MMKTTPALLTVLTLLAPTVGAQNLYKCVQGGKTVYQAAPCPADAAQDALKPQGDGPSSALATDAEIDGMIEFLSTYRACADGIAIWGQEMAEPYKAWRASHRAMVSRIETDRSLQARYQQRVDAKRNGKAGLCRDVALELRGKKP